VYDLYGNTVEWCRDKFVSNLGTNDVVNPVVTTGSDRVLRGSRYDRTWDYAHSAYRGSDVPDRTSKQAKAYGFRVMCPVTLKFGK
jgi:formylglycine-generating enzyme required for sulfatase activity